MLISPSPVPKGDRRNAYLVVARYLRAKSIKSDYPLYTVICDDPDEAIAYVLGQGFSFSRGEWSIRAIHVALVGGEQQSKTARP